MGLQKLTPEEREALRQRVEFLIQLAMQTPGASDPASKQRATANQQRASSAPERGAYSSVGKGHWIKENVERGSYIVLEDRSLWRVDPLDKIDAMLWLVTESITVVESSDGSPGYSYLLINTSAREQAHAQYVGRQ